MSHENGQTISAAKLALAVRRLREDPQATLVHSDPIAIVGIGCRFPGGITSPAEYWQVLREGIDTITEVPRERWDSKAYYDADAHTPGKTNCVFGGFIEHADRFDPVLFGISPREAVSIDPQQRVLLEVAWEAVWDSGRPVDSLSGTATGVFIAITGSEYERASFAEAAAIGAQTCAGTFHSVAAGRISFLLDLHGPAISVDTACSSSLVAVHMACQSLRSRECTMALAGGVALHFLPEHYVGLAKLGMLAPDGRCKTFDASADGFVPSDGCGMVVLKRLSDALADDDFVYAVIRGTAVNQDGRTNVLTAPNGLAQQRVVRSALQNARVAPSAISFVETHGTGTALGDPIEVEALAAVLGAPTEAGQPCALGAVKTNLGHTEAVAGVAGLIKTALALRHGEIPPNLHFTKLNSHISLEGTRFIIPTTVLPWPRTQTPRLAGVSSFGFSGTNAHIVLEESPLVPQRARADGPGRPYLLPLSARTPNTLREMASAYRAHLSTPAEDRDMYRICHTAAIRRDHYEERLAVTARTADECTGLLDGFLAGASSPALGRGRAGHGNDGVVFVFSGQGSQWPRMGISLAKAEAVYRSVIEECDEHVRAFGAWSLADALAAPAEDSRLSRTEFAQPAILAVEVALARLWQSWGVVPAAVIGHSSGEIAAAHVAGVMALKDAVRLAVVRGRLMESAAGMGSMAALRLSADATLRKIAPFRGKVSIAAENSRQNTVISGERGAIESICEGLRARGISSKALPVNYAFHSAQMDEYRDLLMAALGPLAVGKPELPILSTVLGDLAETETFDAEYWGRNLREPVLFGAAVERALRMGLLRFLEVGPHPVLLSAVAECRDGDTAPELMVPSLRSGQEELPALLMSMGKLYAAGHKLEWQQVYPRSVPATSVPRYPYQRQRYWLAGRVGGNPEPAADLYEVRWELSPRRPGGEPADGLWWIISEDDAAAKALARELRCRGLAVEVSAPSALPLEAAAVRGVVRLYYSRASCEPQAGAAESCESTLGLIQLLAHAFPAQPPHFWAVTRGAASVDPSESIGALCQTGLLGLIRTAAMEHPELRCTRADVPAEADFGLLASEIAYWDGEEECALRNGKRYVPRLAHCAASPEAPPYQPGATDTWLITGGLGALGLKTAGALANWGVRRLALLGRRSASWEAERQIEALRASGVSVEIRAADVCDRTQLQAVIQAIQGNGRLAGVIHAAGVVDDGIIMHQTARRIERVMAPKIVGGWNLHELTAHLQLDAFILFSSMASLAGSPGQAGYAAGNAFLDGLAKYRRGLGLPALSLNWGAWSGGGMATRLDTEGKRRVLPWIQPMAAERCIAAMAEAWRSGGTQIAIASIAWNAPRPVPRLLANLATAGVGSGPEHCSQAILERLAETPGTNQRKLVLSYLRERAAAVLGLDASYTIDDRQPLIHMGLDSLMAVEFRNQLVSDFGRPLKATLLFDHPTLSELADVLLGAQGKPRPECRDAVLDELAALSDHEAELLLNQELERS